MARSTIPTLMSLDQYAAILTRHPDHFNQTYNLKNKVQMADGLVYFQFGWNHDGHVSRDQIARGIAEAETLIARELGFWPAPKYITNEQMRYVVPRQFPAERYGSRNHPVVNLKWGHFLEGGMQATTSVELGVDITLSRVDTTGDGWEDSFSFTVLDDDASSWVESSIGVFAADDPPDELHRIRDLEVSIAGVAITITGRASKFIKMNEWNKNIALDGDDDTIYLEDVDIYHIYTKSNEGNPPVEFGWESATEVTAYATCQGVLQTVRAEVGEVSVVPATWDDDTEAWIPLSSACLIGYNPPKVIRYNYLAGWPIDDRGRVTPPLDRAIAALVTARLPGPVTGGGESINKIYNYWQEVPDGKTVYGKQICPFGATTGRLGRMDYRAIYASGRRFFLVELQTTFVEVTQNE